MMETNKRKFWLQVFTQSIKDELCDKPLQKVWYLLLLISGGIYVFHFKNEVFYLEYFNTAHLIVLFWLVLLLVPIFSDIELFGFKFKREIKKLDDQMKDIKQSMISLVSQKMSVENYYSSSVPDSEKERLGDQLKKTHPSMTQEDVFNVSNDTIFLFKVRRRVEEVLNSIIYRIKNIDIDYQDRHKMINNIEMKKNINTSDILIFLHDNKKLDHDIFSALREIIYICNKAIHGNDVTSGEVEFVRDTASACVKTLQDILDSLNG